MSAHIPTAGLDVATRIVGDQHVQQVDVLTLPTVDTGLAQPLTDAQLRAAALPVSQASQPLPTGAATEATLAALKQAADAIKAAAETLAGRTINTGAIAGTVAVSNLPGTQPISGTVALDGPTLAALENINATTGGLTNTELRAAAVPVSVSALPLPAGAATDATLIAKIDELLGRLNTAATIPDNQAQGLAVRPIGQDTWVASFSAVGASVIDPQFRTPDVGAGVGYSQAGGALLITSGTTANAEFLTRSVAAWRGTMQMRYSTILSQRIANNNFAVLLADLFGENLTITINSATSITVAKAAHGLTAQNVGQFMFIGGISGAAGVPGRYAIASIPDANAIVFTVAGWPASGSCTADLFGHSHVKHIYNGTTATSAVVNCQRKGWADTDTTATINTSTAPGHIMQAHLMGREITWADMLRASSAAPNVTTRASRFENLPDDNLDLYLFFWSYNGTAAPASTTTWTINFAAVEKFANQPVYIQGQEMQGTAAPAPVAVVGTATASVGTSITGGTISPLTVAGASAEASSAKTATGNSASALTNASARNALFAVNVTAASGTTPTLVVKVQVQDPVSSTWIDLPGAASASITATGAYLITATNLPRTYRLAWTIGGTSPSFTFSVGLIPII